MKCPECGAPYAEELDSCPQCGGDVETERVFRSSNPALVAMVQSVLDNAGVEYWVFGQGIQGVLPADALGGVSIRVPKQRAAQVKALLAELEAEEASDNELDEDDVE